MDIRVREVTSKKDFKKFINLPWNVYKNDKTWVPPLKIAVKELFSKKHPFHETSENTTSFDSFSSFVAISSISLSFRFQ